MYLSVIGVKPLDNYVLELMFENKEVRLFAMKEYLDFGIFTRLRDVDFFNKVHVSFDSIEWPYGIDLDPEILYEKSVAAYQVNASR